MTRLNSGINENLQMFNRLGTERRASWFWVAFICFMGCDPETSSWTTETSANEMTDIETHYARSAWVLSTKPMKFPFDGIKASLVVRRIENFEDIYISFTQNHILNSNAYLYPVTSMNIKWDDGPVETTMIRRELEHYDMLFFVDDREIVKNFKSSDTLLIELDWYTEGNVYFKFPLDGAYSALKRIRNK